MPTRRCRCWRTGATSTSFSSDIKMPGSIDGLALAATARARWPAKPIILTSGHLRHGDFEVPDFATFLQKPYPVAMLLNELGRLSY